LKRARSSGKRVALLFLDLDNFKTVNDSLGHDFGDQVLKAVSRRLRESAALERAFSARLGGDEFTVVCESIESLAEVERLSAAVLEEFQPSLSIYGRELRLSVSVGACIYPDRSEEHTSELQSRENHVCRLLLEKKKRRTLTCAPLPRLAVYSSLRSGVKITAWTGSGRSQSATVPPQWWKPRRQFLRAARGSQRQ